MHKISCKPLLNVHTLLPYSIYLQGAIFRRQKDFMPPWLKQPPGFLLQRLSWQRVPLVYYINKHRHSALNMMWLFDLHTTVSPSCGNTEASPHPSLQIHFVILRQNIHNYLQTQTHKQQVATSMRRQGPNSLLGMQGCPPAPSPPSHSHLHLIPMYPRSNLNLFSTG